MSVENLNKCLSELAQELLVLKNGVGASGEEDVRAIKEAGSKRQRLDESGGASSSAVAELEAKLEASSSTITELKAELEASMARIKDLEGTSGLSAMENRAMQLADAVESLLNSGAIVDGRFADMRMQLAMAQATAVVAAEKAEKAGDLEQQVSMLRMEKATLEARAVVLRDENQRAKEVLEKKGEVDEEMNYLKERVRRLQVLNDSLFPQQGERMRIYEEINKLKKEKQMADDVDSAKEMEEAALESLESLENVMEDLKSTFTVLLRMAREGDKLRVDRIKMCWLNERYHEVKNDRDEYKKQFRQAAHELARDAALRPVRGPVIIRSQEPTVQQQPVHEAETASLKQSLENANRMRDLAEVRFFGFSPREILTV